eukprot:9007330-Alexandrium_andersonii.AAC.1
MPGRRLEASPLAECEDGLARCIECPGGVALTIMPSGRPSSSTRMEALAALLAIHRPEPLNLVTDSWPL